MYASLASLLLLTAPGDLPTRSPVETPAAAITPAPVTVPGAELHLPRGGLEPSALAAPAVLVAGLAAATWLLRRRRRPAARRLDMLLDVPLEVNVELGRTRMTIQDLLQLGPGSVIELDKVAGEALDILVNGRLVARGEAVVVNDKFGVRITDIVSPAERVARLR